jgi:hypothetical protein
VLRGWATAELLDSYEAVRRPVALHQVERAGQPDGARRDAGDALPWDLNGRAVHRWITDHRRVVSTLDLVRDGFTLFAGPQEPRWTAATLNAPAPLRIHSFSEIDARALDIPLVGARLFGPDAREITAWDNYDDFLQASPAAPWLP